MGDESGYRASGLSVEPAVSGMEPVRRVPFEEGLAGGLRLSGPQRAGFGSFLK